MTYPEMYLAFWALPLDAIDFATLLLRSMDAGKNAGSPFLISTPNVNFS